MMGFIFAMALNAQIPDIQIVDSKDDSSVVWILISRNKKAPCAFRVKKTDLKDNADIVVDEIIEKCRLDR